MADPSRLRLGVSSQILPFTQEEVLKADYRFNKFVVNSVQNTVKGLFVGALASVFFKRKGIIFYSAGFGLGYTYFTTFAPWSSKISIIIKSFLFANLLTKFTRYAQS